jgi:hypothetical protein
VQAFCIGAKDCGFNLQKSWGQRPLIDPPELVSGCYGIDYICSVGSEVFLSPAFNAKMRIILFLWDTEHVGGLSITSASPFLRLIDQL